MNTELELMFYRQQYQHIMSTLFKAGYDPAQGSLSEWISNATR